MNTQDFLELLQSHKEKQLHFSYASGQYIAEDYHMTEIKNIRVQGVNCGAKLEEWHETLVQLLDAPEQKNISMRCLKAIGILKKSDHILPLVANALIKFEYGNSTFHTAQLDVKAYTVEENRLVIHLKPSVTLCKAPEACGLPENAEEVAESTSCCSPKNGCC